MVVEYNENEVNNDQIIKAVVDAGYNAEIEDNKKSSKQTENKVQKSQTNAIESMKKRLIISICFLIPLMYISMHQMFNEWFGLPIPEIIKTLFSGSRNAISFAFAQFLLLLPIMYVNRNYFTVGFKRLFKRSPNMDSLIAIGSSAATIYGIFAIFMISYGFSSNQLNIVEKYSKDIYFESAGTILTLITLGKYLETKAKGRTNDAISKLINLAPKTAIILKDNKGIEVNVEEITVGDIVIIKPGTSIPVDGIVIEGISSVDQSSITGESIPVEKTIDDTVVSGTINKNGFLKIKATRVKEDTTLAQIIKLVEEASNSKAPISKIADKVSGIFVPVVIGISIVTFIIWILTGQSFEFALTSAIAVLVISCPCALGLATPVAIMVGTGKGAENGILIKSAESLELLHLIDTVVLDKTGTITEGKPKVTDIYSKITEKELLQIAGSLEKNSEHPLAEAIMEEIEKRNIIPEQIEDFSSFPGRGIKGNLGDNSFFGGNLAFMKENSINIDNEKAKVEELEGSGKTCLFFAKNNELIGIIAVADTIKSTSNSAIEELKKLKIKVIMLTGDNKIASNAIGKKVEVDEIISEVMPEDKEKEVEKLQKSGSKVAFVGDGINDSPALVRADVGLAIGNGTDIAIESADVVLMKNNLLDVVTAINLSKSVIKNIKMNLFWAFFYNTIGIPIAAGALYSSLGLKLNPMIGALAMSLSSVCVVTNALRLKRFKPKYNLQKAKIINNKEEINMKTIKIEGMSCNHCKMTVEKTLNSIEGIKNAVVNLEEKTATFECEKEISEEIIKTAIEEAGFEVKEVK